MIKYKLSSKTSTQTIEYLGLPASGKTTHLKLMQKRYENIINVNNTFGKNFVRRQINKILYMLKFFWKEPAVFIKDTMIIIDSHQKSILDLIKVLLNWFMVSYSYIEMSFNKNYFYIWDQGIYQAIWTILLTSNDPKRLNIGELLKDKRLPDEIIFLDQEDEILKVRASNRGERLRLNYDDDKQILKARESMIDILKFLKEKGYKEDNRIKNDINF